MVSFLCLTLEISAVASLQNHQLVESCSWRLLKVISDGGGVVHSLMYLHIVHEALNSYIFTSPLPLILIGQFSNPRLKAWIHIHYLASLLDRDWLVFQTLKVSSASLLPNPWPRAYRRGFGCILWDTGQEFTWLCHSLWTVSWALFSGNM